MWGDRAVKVIGEWDFHMKREYLLSHFSKENRSWSWRCVGPQVVFSLLLLVFSGKSDHRAARASDLEKGVVFVRISKAFVS